MKSNFNIKFKYELKVQINDNYYDIFYLLTILSKLVTGKPIKIKDTSIINYLINCGNCTRIGWRKISAETTEAINFCEELHFCLQKEVFWFNSNARRR